MTQDIITHVFEHHCTDGVHGIAKSGKIERYEGDTTELHSVFANGCKIERYEGGTTELHPVFANSAKLSVAGCVLHVSITPHFGSGPLLCKQNAPLCGTAFCTRA